MISASDDHQTGSYSALHCSSCQARLAYDQRYCVACGERRGPLPRPVSELVGGLLEQGRQALPVPVPIGPAGRLGAADSGAPRPMVFGALTPRTAAVAVMAMLAFGVAVGSAVGTGSFVSLAGAPLVVLSEAGAPGAVAGSVSPVAAAANSGSGGPSGGQQTITITQSAPQAATGTTPASSSGGGGGGTTGGGGGSSNALGLPPIKHVFLIVLSDQGYFQTFASPTEKYLAQTLPKQGKLVEFYYGVSAGPLANQIAMISGQGPTKQTAADCPKYTKIAPARKGKKGQVIGNGCIYPKTTQTLLDQLTAAHDTWKAYVQGMASGATGKQTTCRRPPPGGSNYGQVHTAKDPYVIWRNPFIYFGSLTGGSACQDDDVDLTQLSTDLKSTSSTPNFSYVVADPCDDGSAQPCTPHAKAGLAPADHVPAHGRARDRGVGRVQGRRPDHGYLRPSPADREACGSERLLQQPHVSEPAPSTSTTPAAAADVGTPTTSTTTGTVISTSTVTAPTTDTSTLTSPTLTSTTSPTTTTLTSPTTTLTTITSPTTTLTSPTTTTSPTSTTTTATPPPTSTAPPSTSTTVTTSTTTTTTATTPPAGGGSARRRPTGGGGQVGMLLISPYVKPGTSDTIELLQPLLAAASIENIFGLKHSATPATRPCRCSDSGHVRRLPVESVAPAAAVEQLEEAPQQHRPRGLVREHERLALERAAGHQQRLDLACTCGSRWRRGACPARRSSSRPSAGSAPCS